jgi:hypothetical protein
VQLDLLVGARRTSSQAFEGQTYFSAGQQMWGSAYVSYRPRFSFVKSI